MEKSIGMDTDLSLVDQITKEFFNVASASNFAGGKEKIAPSQMSPLTLAFIGDCIFDLVVRTIVVENGNAPVNKLHNRAAHYVKAPSQMIMLNLIKDELTEEEMAVYKRGRNAKSYTTAKNATKIDYRMATGYEALIGYLYMMDNMDRIFYLVKYGLDKVQNDK